MGHGETEFAFVDIKNAKLVIEFIANYFRTE